MQASSEGFMVFHSAMEQSGSDDEALDKLKKLGLVENVRKKTLRDIEAILESAIRKSNKEIASPVALRDKVKNELSDIKEDVSTKKPESQDSILSKQINAVNKSGDTVLLAAFKRGFIKCVVLLLQNYAEHQVLDTAGRDLLSYVNEKRKSKNFFTLDLDVKSYEEVLNLLGAQEDFTSFLSDVSSQAPSGRNSVILHDPLVPADVRMSQFQDGDDEAEFGELAEVNLGSESSSRRVSIKTGVSSLLVQNTCFRPITPFDHKQQARSKSLSIPSSPEKVNSQLHRSSVITTAHAKKASMPFFEDGSLASSVSVSRSETPIQLDSSSGRDTAILRGLTSLVDETKAGTLSGRNSACSLASDVTLASICSTESTKGYKEFVANRFREVASIISKAEDRITPPARTGTPLAPPSPRGPK